MRLFGHVYHLVPINEIARKMALARKVQNYTLKIALGPFTQCLVLYLEGLYSCGQANTLNLVTQLWKV